MVSQLSLGWTDLERRILILTKPTYRADIATWKYILINISKHASRLLIPDQINKNSFNNMNFQKKKFRDLIFTPRSNSFLNNIMEFYKIWIQNWNTPSTLKILIFPKKIYKIYFFKKFNFFKSCIICRYLLSIYIK